MNLLELFAGSRSVGNIAEKMGFNVFSVDINDFDGIDLVKDIEFITETDIPFKADVIWASPPCTTYSLAGISHHRHKCKPVSDFAFKSDNLVIKTLEIISWFDDCKWYIENPRATLRKQSFMDGLPRTTITYCQYGDTRMKPTDIWTNNLYSIFNQSGWNPRPMCKNGDKCHQSAPRGSKTGTQGLKNNYERSKIPEQLIIDILKSSVSFSK